MNFLKTKQLYKDNIKFNYFDYFLTACNFFDVFVFLMFFSLLFPTKPKPTTTKLPNHTLFFGSNQIQTK